ncbi:uncharacterized protein LOC121107070 isoform X4 [Gallus gallus]|uniref:uncharacterized protein LOC121107070 isoform X4 n=1 Tax=Gallus gallus TaxID=9031 RepID=UPI001AEB33EA|nr:uncharacterized protein LOC121107070 isoform X4 [Gallus gallus]
MSQHGDDRGSNCCRLSGKKRRGAVPRGWEQQPAGCQRSDRAFQRTEGRNRDGRSFMPYRRMEPARPWSGAGQGWKRKASAEADASGLPAKRSLAERQGRSAQCGTAPKRGTDTQQAPGFGALSL